MKCLGKGTQLLKKSNKTDRYDTQIHHFALPVAVPVA